MKGPAIVLILLFLWATIVTTQPGCTQGQLAPAAIKNCVYAARADAIATAAAIRHDQAASTQPADPAALLEAALRALDRIGGTPPSYEDGLLAPVTHWFSGTKSAPTVQGGAQ